MNFHGRQIDPIQLWSEFTDIPDNRRGETPFIHGLWCPNPEHSNSRKPGPFQINVTQPTVHCFAECGISGSYERAIAIIKGLTNARGEPNAYAARKIILKLTAGYGASIRKLSADGERNRSKRKSVAVVSDLEFETFIPSFGTKYLEARGITGSSISKWGLGWDSDERRIVIPAEDENGTLRFLIKRAVRDKDWPKYLYSEGAEKTSLLFGACKLDRKLVRSDGLVLVEGSVDTIKNHQNGLTNTAGQLGSRLSERQRDIIAHYKPPRIYTFFDKNAAGARATRAAHDLLRSYPLFVVLYPKGREDPGEMSGEEVERAIDKAVPYAIFMRRMRKHVPERDKEKRRIHVG